MIDDLIGKIHNIDCLSFMKQLPDKCIDLVLTDPPYEFISNDNGLTGGGFMKQQTKKHLENIKNSFGIRYNPDKYLIECKRILKIFNAYFFTNKSLLKNYIDFAECNNFNWELLIWSKPNPCPLNNNHYLLDKEYIIFIKDSGAIFNSNLGYKKYFTVISHPIGNNNDTEHPTQKPMFIKKFIEISSNKNDIVFDGYFGSGTTAIACEELNRRWIGCEISKQYCDIAQKRLDDYRKQLKLF